MFPESSTSQRVGNVRSFLTVFFLTLWFVGVGLQGCATLGPDSGQAQEDPTPRQIQASFLSVPLSFEANQGQTDPQVKFLARGPGYGLFLTPTEAVLALRHAEPTDPNHPELDTTPTPSESAVLRMRLVGANSTPALSGETALPGRVNYFMGKDPKKWRTNVPTYAKARYTNVYPGIDLLYYGHQGQLEYDFVVAPGQDPTSITMAFQGAEQLELEATGDLLMQTAGGAIRQRKPVIYQNVSGERQAIDGTYLLKPDNQVGFQVAAYDTTKPLIIDPILVFSTYLGGSSSSDQPHGIAVDGAGQVYVTGSTRSRDFPTQNPLQPDLGGDSDLGRDDVFVTKLTADGSALVYSTYLGGSNHDSGRDIAVDGAGQVSITGRTGSTNFPTRNALQPDLGGGPDLGHDDAFVAKLTADGSALVYATYLGGSGSDGSSGIAVDGAGQAYVTGRTESSDFPTQKPLQPALGGSVDVFVTKLTADGSALVYATYLGGSEDDRASGIAVDGAGQVYVTGSTFSTDFPSQNPLQSALGSAQDAFVTKLSADGAALVYSTFLGGSSGDGGAGIAVDGAGQVSVIGSTRSPDFPTQNPLQPAFGGGPFLGRIVSDAFVTKLTVDGSALVYSTYLGGGGADSGWDIAVDGAGQVSVMGNTGSSNFPTRNAVQPVCGNCGLFSASDAFVTKLSADGAALVYSTFLGGSGNEGSSGIAVDGAGQAYVTGFTDSPDFPNRNALQPALAGFRDAFVVKIDPLGQTLNDKFAPLFPRDVTTALSAIPCGGATAGTFTITATFTNISADTLANLELAVFTLSRGNVLCNANGGPGGSTLTVPLEGDLADGQLSPGEAFVVELLVGLQRVTPFTFVVDVLGEEVAP